VDKILRAESLLELGKLALGKITLSCPPGDLGLILGIIAWIIINVVSLYSL
jgi:hypothetical protein